MATSKVLQKPSIISIIGSTIRVAHPDIKGYRNTTLAGPISAGGTPLSVLDNDGFSNADWVLVGNVGDNTTEEVDINGAVTRGTALAINNTLKFPHSIDALLTRILERKVIIYGAFTEGGAGTVITSVSAAGVNIQWDKAYTEINLITTDATYNFYYATFYDGATESSASDYIPASGVASNTVSEFVSRALSLTNTKINHQGITNEMLIGWANEAQDAVAQFRYREPLSGRYVAKNWSFEIIRDTTSITLTQNENEYALSGLSSSIKYANTAQAIISLQIGDREPLERITATEMDEVLVNQHRTELTVAAAIGDTSITVTDTSAFDDSGTIAVGTDTSVTYTGKTSTTFTGIPTSDITAIQAIGSIILQGRSPGSARQYCVDSGNIRFDIGADSTRAGLKIKIRYFKKLTALTEMSDKTDVTFTNAFPLFIASKILYRRGKDVRADRFFKQFDQILMDNAMADQIPNTNPRPYYIYDSFDSLNRRGVDDDNC